MNTDNYEKAKKLIEEIRDMEAVEMTLRTPDYHYTGTAGMVLKLLGRDGQLVVEKLAHSNAVEKLRKLRSELEEL